MSNNDSDQITVYRPNQRHELGLLRTWAVMARNVAHSRELIWQLFKRDFTAQYKKSFIGITWIFLMPLFGILHWVLLERTNILAPGEMVEDIPYTVYLLVGTTMWGLFVQLFSNASRTLMAEQSLVMQVNYSHEALLFKQTAQALAKFTIAFGMNLVVLGLFRLVPSWQTVLLPVVVLPMFLLASALGLIVSMIAVVAVDLSRAVSRGMALLMMLTPVIYVAKTPAEVASAPDATWWNEFLARVNLYNPLTYLVCSARDIVLYGRLYDPKGYAICAVGSLLLFMVSWRLFFVSEDKLIERMI